MRRLLGIVAAISIAVPVALSTASPALANPSGPDAYDIQTSAINISRVAVPPGYPRWANGLFVKMDSNWGRADTPVPAGLATPVGVNVGNAENATNCRPTPEEGGSALTGAERHAFIEANCRINRNTLVLNIGSTAAPSDQPAWEYSGSHRRLFWRKSPTSTCPNQMTETATIPYGARTFEFRRTNLPQVGEFICFAEGFEVKTRYYEGGSIQNGTYRYLLRGNWTVFKVVGLGDQMKPTAVTGTPADRSVSVSWTYPNLADPTGVLVDRLLRATRFTVTSTPDGRECRVVGQLRCRVSNLRNGVAYTFTVKAEVNHQTITSDPSAAVTPARIPADPATAPTANTPEVTSRDGSPLVAGTTVRVRSTTNGSLRAGESANPRRLNVCYVPSEGAACSGIPEGYNLPNSLRLVDSQVRIPATAAGSFMRITQYFNLAPQNWIQESRPAYYPVVAPAAAPSASASASASPSASASSAATANVTPLTPRPATGSVARAGNRIDLWSMVTGSALPAGQSVGQRQMTYCYARTNGGACDNASVLIELPLNLLRATTSLTIPADRASQFLRVQQLIAIAPSPGRIGAPRLSAVGYIPIGSAE